MAMDPSKLPAVLDLFQTNGTSGLGTQTGTKAYDSFALPPGKKAVQIALVTSATVTLNIQNSLDNTNFVNVISSTNSSAIWEVDSVVPFWRLNITSHTTSGTGSGAAMVARITQGPV